MVSPVAASLAASLAGRSVPDLARAQVVIIGAGEMAELAVEALRKGAFDYHMKPIDFQRMESSVANGVERGTRSYTDVVRFVLGTALRAAGDTLTPIAYALGAYIRTSPSECAPARCTGCRRIVTATGSVDSITTE